MSDKKPLYKEYEHAFRAEILQRIAAATPTEFDLKAVITPKPGTFYSLFRVEAAIMWRSIADVPGDSNWMKRAITEAAQNLVAVLYRPFLPELFAMRGQVKELLRRLEYDLRFHPHPDEGTSLEAAKNMVELIDSMVARIQGEETDGEL